jgi:light-regulated signal transduction histidine kinase (bacteriophytochrome)
MPNGERWRLEMGCAADGQSGCLVFDNQIASSSDSRLQPVMDYFAASLTDLEASVLAVDGFCENLEHENHGELRGHGGFYLKSLRRQWNRVDETLRELHMSLDLVRKTEDGELTDPGLILSRAFEDASARRPEDSVELRLPDLPKSMIDRSRLTAVMRSLMVHLVHAAESAVQVESQITDELLRLRFIVPVTPATRARVERSWHGSAVCASDIAPVTGGRVLSLAAIKGLAAVSGGELQLKSSDQDSLVFELSFPSLAASQNA